MKSNKAILSSLLLLPLLACQLVKVSPSVQPACGLAEEAILVPATPQSTKEDVTYTDKLAYLPSISLESIVCPQVDVSAYRYREDLKIKLSIDQQTWPEQADINIYLHIGEKDDVNWDENTYLLKILPSSGISSFVYLGGPQSNQAVNKNEALSFSNEGGFAILSLDLRALSISYVLSDCSFGASISTKDEILTTLNFHGRSIDLKDVSSYVWASLNGTFSEGGYQFVKDSTEYIDDFGLIPNQEIQSGDNTGELEIRAKRSAKEVSLLIATSLSEFSENLALSFFFDGSNYDSTERSKDSWCLRILPRKRTVVDYFYLAGEKQNQPISQEGLSFRWGLREVKVSLDVSNIGGVSYETNDLGICLASSNSELVTLASIKRGNQTTNPTNPSTYLWLKADGTFCDTSYYDLSKDTLPYQDCGYIPASTNASTNISHGRIDLKVYRSGKNVTIQSILESGSWNSLYYLAFLMECGDSSTSARTDNSVCLRVMPDSRGVMAFFYLGPDNYNTQIATNKVIVKASNNAVRVSFDISDVVSDYTVDFGFSVYSATKAASIIIGTQIKDSYSFNYRNPSTFIWFSNDGSIITAGEYDPQKDTTVYTYLGYLAAKESYFSKVDIFVARVGTTLTTKYVLESGALLDTYFFHFYLQIGDKTSTTRTDTCAVYRIKPATKDLFAFFYLGPDNRDQSLLSSSYAQSVKTKNNTTTLQVSFDLRIVSESCLQENVGLAVYASTSTYGSLGVMNRDSYSIMTSNPSTFVWMNPEGSIIA